MPDAHPAPDDADDPRLEPLIAWRQQLIDSGAVSARSFKEAHLRMVLRSKRTDVDEIAAMLPGAAAEHAEDLVRVLTELGSAPATSDDAAPPGRHHTPALEATPDSGEDAERTTMFGASAKPQPRQVTETPPAAADFAPFAFGPQSTELHAVTPARRSPTELALSWPPFRPPAAAAETVVLYRLISTDEGRPYSPDRAELLSVTTATTTIDPRPPAAAVRHYQVWVNAAATRAEALAAQPVLHAEGVLISPVTGHSIREDNGRVIGQWQVPPGVAAVHIYRVPADAPHRDGPQYRILAGADNLTGFVDIEAQRGAAYTYRVRAAATVEEVTRLSEAVDVDIEISAVLTPVTDLAATATGDGSSFDLTWTPPQHGHVVIYRSQDPPRAGAESAELPETALEQIGLTPELRLTQPISQRSDAGQKSQSAMTGVSWPANWSRAYLTPVTLLGGRALLGAAVSSVRTGAIRDVELAEYCNKQVLTFDWPAGAAAVAVHLAPKGHDPRTGLTGKNFEISAEEYQRYGGMQLTGQLPVGGCSLHLSPVAFTGGRRVTGAVRSVEYAGLLRLQYAVRLGRDAAGVPTHATVALRSEHDLPGSPAFVLVNNPQRIPLSIADGEPLDVAPVDPQGRLTDAPSKELRWSALTTHGTGELWAANLHGRHGWIRLFVNTPSAARLRTIALLDPPVEALRLTVIAPAGPK